MEIIKGMGLLLLTLGLFSVFSMKAPKGNEAMSGLANAAVATFLVEAIHKYISGDFLGLEFLGHVGEASGSLGGVAAAGLVALSMGASPVLAIAGAVALSGFGILPGFIAGYAIGIIAPYLERKLPEGIDVILGALLLAPLARGLAVVSDPIVNSTLVSIGSMISTAAEQSPLVMGFLLGGIMKVICTSPLSAMALTAMLSLKGLAMGIAAIACFGGAFSDGVVYKRLGFGDKSGAIGIMLEPLTQAHIVTRNPLPIYSSNFFGGGIAGVFAALFGIVNNAPGTASPIPGLIAPFGFNDPINVLLALVCGALGGCLSGFVGSQVFKKIKYKPNIPETLDKVA